MPALNDERGPPRGEPVASSRHSRPTLSRSRAKHLTERRWGMVHGGKGIDLVARKAEVNCPCLCALKVSDFFYLRFQKRDLMQLRGDRKFVTYLHIFRTGKRAKAITRPRRPSELNIRDPETAATMVTDLFMVIRSREGEEVVRSVTYCTFLYVLRFVFG